MLAVITWIWGDRFEDRHVVNVFRGFNRHLRQQYRRICFTDRKRNLPDNVEQHPIPNPELQVGVCARLRLFDPEFQKAMGLFDRIVSLDIDCVVTGPLDHLFDRPEPFTCMQHINTVNPCTFCPCLTMLRAGYRSDVWADFDVEKWNVPTQGVPSDESWIWYKLPEAAAWMAKDGVYVRNKRQWPGGDTLPENASIVFFQGKADPRKFLHLDWVAKNWK